MTLLWLPATLMVNLHCYRLSVSTTPSTEIFTGPTNKYPETTAFMYQSILTSEPAFVCLPSDEETNSTLLVKPSPKTHQPLSSLPTRRSFPHHIADGNLVVIPDARQPPRSTTNAAESDLSLLKKGGLNVKAQSSNPAIEDGINSINVLLLANRLKVHNSCKYLIKSLETQAYTKTGKPEKGIGGKDDVSGPVDALVTAYIFWPRCVVGPPAAPRSGFTKDRPD